MGHGSRDPRLQTELEALADHLRNNLPLTSSHTKSAPPLAWQLKHDAGNNNQASPLTKVNATAANETILVDTAVLEFGQQSLHQKIVEFSKRTTDHGLLGIHLLPLFLLPGIHVLEDIPAELNRAREQLDRQIGGEKIDLLLHPHLGSYAPLMQLLEPSMGSQNHKKDEALILVAHRSRRSEAQDFTQALKFNLNAEIAYWAGVPKLEEKVAHLAQQGKQKISVLPYFLFSGGIKDRILENISTLSYQFPNIHLELLNPLRISPSLMHLIATWAQEAAVPSFTN